MGYRTNMYNKEGGTSSCVVQEAFDLHSANDMLIKLEQGLHPGLNFLTEWKSRYQAQSFDAASANGTTNRRIS